MFNKLMRALRKGHKDEKGITGLETAIILIAFVTVAAVFGYAVLSAGIFSAEKGKETVYLGLEEAKSTMCLKGSVIAKSSDNLTVTSFDFTVANTLAGEPIDLTEPPDDNKCVLTYIDNNNYENDKTWTKEWIGYNDGDDLLETGEKALISVDLSDLGTALGINTQFTIELKPPVGATVTIERTTPANIDAFMDLH